MYSPFITYKDIAMIKHILHGVMGSGESSQPAHAIHAQQSQQCCTILTTTNSVITVTSPRFSLSLPWRYAYSRRTLRAYSY